MFFAIARNEFSKNAIFVFLITKFNKRESRITDIKTTFFIKVRL